VGKVFPMVSMEEVVVVARRIHTRRTAGGGGGHGTCHNYGRPGHWACKCRAKKEAEAHTVQDDESSLLLVKAGEVKIDVVSLPPSTTPTIDSPSGDPLKRAASDELVHGDHGQNLCRTEMVVHMVEEKVFAQFSDVK
jgi:hypothetical protein